MSRLRQALGSDASLIARLKVRPTLHELPRAVRAMRSDGGEFAPVETLDDFQSRMFEIIACGDMSRITKRELRRLPDAMFASPRPLARQEGVRDLVLGELHLRGQRSAVYALAAQYVERFDPEDADFAFVAQWLAKAVMRWDWMLADRQARLAFFDPSRAPRSIAELALSSERRPKEILEDLGLIESAQGGGLGAAAFSAGCHIVAAMVGKGALGSQNKLLEWSTVDGAYAYDKQWEDFAQALLAPWSGAEGPPEYHQERISEALIAFAGDPRTTVRQLKWERVKARDARLFDLLIGWLTRAAILQFLDVVGQSALDEHWRYRRAFWESYLNAGHIDRAWVAFGSNAVALARRTQSSSKNTTRPFGEVERGTGRNSDQSALILQIGDVTIADWSHSGKYNVWLPGAPNRPDLFKSRYSAWSLDAAVIREAHNGSDRYSWQERLAGLIQNHTGRRVDRSTWKPRRYWRY